MLKKKREKPESSDEHGGRAIESVLKYSTVPRDDAMEFEEVLTMDREGSIVGLEDAGERPDFRYLAWLLRKKLKAFVDGGQTEPPELELQSLLNLATSRKIISVDLKLPYPVLWRTLPKELFMLVLARLPLPDIARLRSLSKEWNRDMATVNSDINRALDEASPIVVVGFSRHEIQDIFYSYSEFFVTVCTQMLQYSYHLVPGNPIIVEFGWHDMGAVDGGLACFVSTWKPNKEFPQCIVVVNLLTRVWRKLPRGKYVYLKPPKMMHIKVDSKTKCYRVVVVGKKRKGRRTVEIYDSGARQWTKATPSLGSIFGLAHSWYYDDESDSFSLVYPYTTLCMYDFDEGQLKRCCDLMGPSEGDSVITYAHHQDCMFVVHRNTFHGDLLPAEGCCITKYRMQNNLKDWVQERLYTCSPFEDLLEKDYDSLCIDACEDFMMMFNEASGSCGPFWLLDLSTGEWSTLPNHFEGCLEGHGSGTFMMTRASWNVVPWWIVYVKMHKVSWY